MTDARFAHRSALVIDDEVFSRALIARMLTGLGFRNVYQASDGATGLTAVGDLNPDVVVCDVQMKPVNGLAFARTLRDSDNETHRRLPVLFVTNALDADSYATIQDLGDHNLLLKPVTANLLKEALSVCLGNS